MHARARHALLLAVSAVIVVALWLVYRGKEHVPVRDCQNAVIRETRQTTAESSPGGHCTGPLIDRDNIPGAPARYVDQLCAYDRETVRRTQEHAGAHGWRPFPDYDNANDWIALANLPDLPCNCPLMQTFECAVWDRQIAHDLAPWINVSLPHEVFDQPFESYERGPITYRLRMNEWGIQLETRGETSHYHAGFERMLRDIQQKIHGIPLFVLAGHLWDHPKVPNQDPIPLFGQMKRVDSNDILLPIWETFGYPGVECNNVLADRKPVLYYRGGCMGPEMGYYNRMLPYYRRHRVGRLSRQYPDVIDGGIARGGPCMRRYNNDDSSADVRVFASQQDTERSYDSFERVCDFRYTLVVDGNTAAHRLKYLLRAGVVVFLQHSVFYEFYHFLLQPYVHYVPVSSNLENLVEQVHWANAHPAEIEAISRNARELAERYLTYENHLCYMHRVFSFVSLKQSLHE